MPDVTDVRLTRELFDFLVGEGPLNGCWFGDRPADAKGAFWWRKELRKCAALDPVPNARLITAAPDLLAALKVVERDRANCNGRVLEMHATMIRDAIAKAEEPNGA